MRKLVCALYVLTILVMAAATIIEKYQGTPFVSTYIYGAWWFSLLWALLAAAGVAWLLRRRVRKWYLITLHASFLFILLGALLTHTTSRRGVIHLRQGQPTTEYSDEHGETRKLPFQITLNKFHVSYHSGTMAAADYSSDITVTDGKVERRAQVSMNHIYSYHNTRLYQNSYDEDGLGSFLSLNSDPLGIPVTYLGYALLFIALIWMLITPGGTFRRLLRSPELQKGALSLLLFCTAGAPSVMAALTVLPQETAERIGRLYIVYNDRVCPVETYALDFTKKLYGKRHYGDYSALQVLTGFMFFSDEWNNEPVIRIKGNELKSHFHLGDYETVNTLLNPTDGGYVLGPVIQDYYQGAHDELHKQAAKTDDKLMLIMELRQQQPLKIFPHTNTHGIVKWYAPSNELPASIGAEHRKYIQNVLTLLTEDIRAGRYDRANEGLDRMLLYQQRFGAASIPSPLRVKAEHIYNKVSFATILFMVCLTMGFVTLFLFMWRLSRSQNAPISLIARLFSEYLPLAIFFLSFLALTLCEALRWIISGTIPLSNGYETMLFMAWVVMLITLLGYRRFHILLTFGFLLSGFFLLVSHISQMDPMIGHVMPVLNSPLLTIHVSIIMMSYALISLTFIIGVTALTAQAFSHRLSRLALLSRLFLYPALTTMGLGIFIGAIWANISWGTYWSWDPKETWALITFMVYAVVVHTQTLPVFSKPKVYHIYMTLAFLSLIMTYFGVNYFLGGMHAYA